MPDHLANIKNFIQDNLKVNTSLTESQAGVAVVRNLQHFFTKRFLDQGSNSIYQIVLDHASKAETICPTAGLAFMKAFAGCHLDFSNGHNSNKSLTKSEIGKFLVEKLGISSQNRDIVMSAIEMASIGSKISIKKSANHNTFVEVIDGYSFSSKKILQCPKVIERPKIICIDGYVESVSEIHHLLEDFAESKNAGVLFVRGMHDDVVHTLKVNNDRGTLQLYPILIPFEVEEINTLVDIAVVSNSDVISHLKGDLISSIDTAIVKHVDSIVVNSNYVVIRNAASKNRVELHRRQLLERLQERPEIEDLLRRRVKSLTSSYVEISISSDINFLSNSQQVDEGIRYVMSLIDSKKEPEEVALKYYEICCNTIKNMAIH